MHISLHILAEELAVLNMDVLSCERRRGIATFSRMEAEPRDNVLYVATPAEVAQVEVLPRHLALVCNMGSRDIEVLAGVPNLAVIETDESIDAAIGAFGEAFMGISNWDSRMLEAIAAQHEIDSVLAIASERLHNPIALFDSKQALLSYVGELSPNSEGTIWEEVLHNRYAPIEFYSASERAELMRLSRQDWPFRMRPAKNPDRENLSRIIRVNGTSIASVGLVDVNETFTEGQVALVDLVCDRLQMALSMRLGSRPSRDDSSYLLRSILNGNKADKGVVAYHLSLLGWRQAEGFRLIACRLPESESGTLADNSMTKRIANISAHSMTLSFEGCIISMLPCGYSQELEKVVSSATSMGLACAASEQFADIADARIAYDQCLFILDNQQGAGPQPLPDVLEGSPVSAIAGALNPRIFCDETIYGLCAYGYNGDAARGKALVRELYVYLLRGCNSHKAARELFLHRNTLVYHIELLEKLMGVKLDELSTSQTLYLVTSCLIALAEKR